MAAKKSARVAGIPGSDPTLPNVPLTVNGTTYHLVFDINAMAKAEELTGLNLIVALDLRGITIVKYRALVYAALLANHPELTIEDAGRLITSHNMSEVTTALLKVYADSMPEVKQSGDSQENPQEASNDNQ